MSGQDVVVDTLPRVVISRFHPDAFRLDGLRPYAEYRDLGFAPATRGAMTAHVLRFLPGYTAGVAGKRHVHDVDFQMVYLFKGWISYEFEGVGPITMHPGNAWTQPPGIRHTVTGYSDDCTLLELVMPVDYDTVDVPPAGTTPDATTPVSHLLKRHAPPQRFVVSRPDDATAGARDFGFDRATGGVVQARLAQLSAREAETAVVPAGRLRLGYVVSGSLRAAFGSEDAGAFREGDCWLEPPDGSRSVVAGPDGCGFMEVTARPAD